MIFLSLNVSAVILAGGDGTQNTSSPAGGQGWEYIGRVDQPGEFSSVTYISNNWFITAHHVHVLAGPTGIVHGAVSYPIDPNSWTRLTNSVGGDADLTMFRVAGGTVGLTGVTVRSASTANGSNLTMIGNGRDREVSETHWDVNTLSNPWIWVEVSPPPPADYAGYVWASGATKRWGTNKKHTNEGLIDDGFGITDMYSTDFDDAGGNEAQGARFDSGGGVFYNSGGSWELAGIMLLVSSYNGQPSDTAVYGNRTYIADMQYFAAQIYNTAQIDDLDEDGLPDGWEYEQTGNTTGVVADADQDGDGFTGEEEWWADTNPTNGSSFLQVLTYTNVSEFIFSSSSNREYEVQYRMDLSDTNEIWFTEVSWTNGEHGQTSLPVSSATSNRFYRVRVKLP